MSDSELQSDAPRDDSETVCRGRRLRRYCCGFALGLSTAGVFVICSVPFVDGLLMRNMEYGPNDLLQDAPVLFGVTVPELVGRIWILLLVGLPLLGVIVQKKPLFRSLDSWHALLIGTVCAATSVGIAIHLVVSNLYYWAYLYI